jgi:cation diffusion facilitator family transporter
VSEHPVRHRLAAAAGAPAGGIGPEAQVPRKSSAAALSIASNGTLIVLKLAAGAITGSIAIVTEAVHSSIDLVASVVAFYSVRKADEPADESHPYGHEKVENVAAAIEGMLILLGAGIIVFESVRRLVHGSKVDTLGVGIAVIALSVVANLAVSARLYRQARLTESAALEGDAAHLRTDALTSAGVLVALVLVQVTGVQQFDAAVALAVAGAIVFAGLRILNRTARVLVDEALPPDELEAVRSAIKDYGSDEVVGFHKLRARRAGSRRYVDLHVQFRDGTTLKRAHELTHELQGEIRSRLRGADVLIHLEPEEAADAAQRRLTAADAPTASRITEYPE